MEREKREMRETGPLAILLYPVLAIGAVGSALLRLICGPCDETDGYGYQY